MNINLYSNSLCLSSVHIFCLFLIFLQLLLAESKLKTCTRKEPCKWVDDECYTKARFTTARCTAGTICRNYQYTKRRSEICPKGYSVHKTVRCTGDNQNTNNYQHFCCQDSKNYTVNGLPYLTPKDHENAETFPDIVGSNIPPPHDPIHPANESRSAYVKQNRWPRGQIPYIINNTKAGFTITQRAEIAKAIANYENNTCLRFYSKTDADNGWISILNDPETNTATNCGLSIICGPYGGSQFSSVGPPCANAEWFVHELGHSLCFGHEHQREDRDTYIKVCSPSSYPLLTAPNWDLQQLPFDFNSIMLYPGCTPGACFQRQPGQGTGRCGEPADGTGRLSAIDIRRVNKYYNCDCSRYKC